MLRMFIGFMGLSLAITSPVLAASPFDGTWKIDVKTADLSKKPDVVLLKDGTYTCSSCVPVFTVVADGASHAMSGFPYFDEAAITVIDPQTISEVDKLKGKVVGTSTTKLSADGNVLTTEWTDTSAPDGKAVTGQSIQQRVAAAPAGAHAISGQWRNTAVANVSDSAVTMTFALTGDMFSMTTPNGYSYTAKIGGPAVPLVGDTAGTMVEVTRPGPMTIVETDVRDGKPRSRLTMKAAPGGTMLKATSENLERGTHTNFTLLKQ